MVNNVWKPLLSHEKSIIEGHNCEQGVEIQQF